jgi:hypothetical protein
MIASVNVVHLAQVILPSIELKSSKSQCQPMPDASDAWTSKNPCLVGSRLATVRTRESNIQSHLIKTIKTRDTPLFRNGFYNKKL